MLAEKRSASQSEIRIRRKVRPVSSQCRTVSKCDGRYKLLIVHCPVWSQRDRETERHPHKHGVMSPHMSESTRNVSVGSESASALNTETCCFCFVKTVVQGKVQVPATPARIIDQLGEIKRFCNILSLARCSWSRS